MIKTTFSECILITYSCRKLGLNSRPKVNEIILIVRIKALFSWEGWITFFLKKNISSFMMTSECFILRKYNCKLYFVLVITYLRVRFGINCPSEYFEKFEIAQVNWGRYQHFQKSWGWFIQNKHVITVNHTKPTNTMYSN